MSTAFRVSDALLGLAFDGTSIWVTNAFGNAVTKLRVSDGAILGTFLVGNNPIGVAFDGANIWVANLMSNDVTKLRAIDARCWEHSLSEVHQPTSLSTGPICGRRTPVATK